MNKILLEEGYYMAEFEVKMMGIVYYLDKGHYRKAFSTLSRFHSQLKNRENLLKVPEFRNADDEMNFYLNLQNPKTGDFMDDSCPYCTFNEPTENVIIYLDELAKNLGVPLRLKYPLKYLDRINTPEKLDDFLDDVSYIGWPGSRFPETTFVFTRSLLSCWNDEGAIRKNNLYNFFDNFKTALLDWFYTHQERTTGYWGPMSSKNGRLIKIDLNNPDINSLRLYGTKSDCRNLTAGVLALAYPDETPVLDVMELVPQITAWLDTVKLSIGNWTSKEQIREDYALLNIKEPLIFKNAFPLDSMNRILQEKKELYIIGFDLLQISRYSTVYLYSPE